MLSILSYVFFFFWWGVASKHQNYFCFLWPRENQTSSSQWFCLLNILSLVSLLILHSIDSKIILGWLPLGTKPLFGSLLKAIDKQGSVWSRLCWTQLAPKREGDQNGLFHSKSVGSLSIAKWTFHNGSAYVYFEYRESTVKGLRSTDLS